MVCLETISKFVPGFAELESEELAAIQEFTLFWTLFESHLLEEGASAGKIKRKSREWAERGALPDCWFQPQLDYFVARYVDNGMLNTRFENLHLRNSDDPDLVANVLLGKNSDLKDQLAACLIIVLRFRNNLFHGKKWAYGIKGQKDNFFHSVRLLAASLDRFSK